MTAGAALLRPDGRVLTIEHRALCKWLLPGGHVEDVTAYSWQFADLLTAEPLRSRVMAAAGM